METSAFLSNNKLIHLSKRWRVTWTSLAAKRRWRSLYKSISHFWRRPRPCGLFGLMKLSQLWVDAEQPPHPTPQKIISNHLFHMSSLSLSEPSFPGGRVFLSPVAPPPVAPEACASSLLQRPTPGSLSPPLQNRLQMNRKVIYPKQKTP